MGLAEDSQPYQNVTPDGSPSTGPTLGRILVDSNKQYQQEMAKRDREMKAEYRSNYLTKHGNTILKEVHVLLKKAGKNKEMLRNGYLVTEITIDEFISSKADCDLEGVVHMLGSYVNDNMGKELATAELQVVIFGKRFDSCNNYDLCGNTTCCGKGNVLGQCLGIASMLIFPIPCCIAYWVYQNGRTSLTIKVTPTVRSE